MHLFSMLERLRSCGQTGDRQHELTVHCRFGITSHVESPSPAMGGAETQAADSVVVSGGNSHGLPDSTFQCAAAKASWMLLAMRPRADPAYPFCLAQSRIAWT